MPTSRAQATQGLRDADIAAMLTPWTTDTGQRAFYPQIAQYDERFLVENLIGITRAAPGAGPPGVVGRPARVTADSSCMRLAAG